jgi:hypothetical protein
MQLRRAHLSCQVPVKPLPVASVFPSTRRLNLIVRPEIVDA